MRRWEIWAEVKNRTFSNKAKYKELLLSAQPRGNGKLGTNLEHGVPKKQDTILKFDLEICKIWAIDYSTSHEENAEQCHNFSTLKDFSHLLLDVHQNQIYLFFAGGFQKSNAWERGQPTEDNGWKRWCSIIKIHIEGARPSCKPCVNLTELYFSFPLVSIPSSLYRHCIPEFIEELNKMRLKNNIVNS